MDRAISEFQRAIAIDDAFAAPHSGLADVYILLGDYEFVSLLEAPDNECVARFSVELGVRAGAHIATMPAIPISRLTDPGFEDVLRATLEASKDPEI